MIYRTGSALGQRMDRKVSRLVRELRGSCALLANEAEIFEYQMDMTLRGQAWGEILAQIEDEALTVVGMCEHVRKLLEEGAGICLI